MELFLRNFNYVPDDKLTWSPTPTSKSALQVAAHVAVHAGLFAKMIRDRRPPAQESIEAFLADRQAREMAISTREEAARVFREGTQEVLDALDGVTSEEIDAMPESNLETLKQLMNVPGWHATLHLGQIDYLQTCWDDQHVYVE